MTKMITCLVCGEVKELYCKNMCRPCYNKQYHKLNINKIDRKSKHLHCITEECVQITTQLIYNIKTGYIKIGNYFRNRNYKSKPLNKLSSNYLGVTCAEQVLEQIFKNVQIMPYGNKGFDFICGNGFRVDSKASIKCKDNYWTFNIRKNKTADYFALLAFDNREDVNPLYFWLIPGDAINDNVGIRISQLTINKWNKYEQPIDKVIKCCDNLRGDK